MKYNTCLQLELQLAFSSFTIKFYVAVSCFALRSQDSGTPQVCFERSKLAGAIQLHSMVFPLPFSGCGSSVTKEMCVKFTVAFYLHLCLEFGLALSVFLCQVIYSPLHYAALLKNCHTKNTDLSLKMSFLSASFSTVLTPLFEMRFYKPGDRPV